MTSLVIVYYLQQLTALCIIRNPQSVNEKAEYRSIDDVTTRCNCEPILQLVLLRWGPLVECNQCCCHHVVCCCCLCIAVLLMNSDVCMNGSIIYLFMHSSTIRKALKLNININRTKENPI